MARLEIVVQALSENNSGADRRQPMELFTKATKTRDEGSIGRFDLRGDFSGVGQDAGETAGVTQW